LKNMIGALFLGLFLFVVCTCYSLAHAVIEVLSGIWVIARGLVILVGSPFVTARLAVEAAQRYARGESLERILDVTPKRPAVAGPERKRQRSRRVVDATDDRWRRLSRISGPLPGL